MKFTTSPDYRPPGRNAAMNRESRPRFTDHFFPWWHLLALMLGFAAPAGADPRIGPDGHEYEIIYYTDRQLTWDQARIEAGTAGGGLAVIRSEEVDVFIERLRQEALAATGVNPAATTSPSLWIGGAQTAGASRPVDNWNWVGVFGGIPGDANVPGYSNWLPGEPNDYPSPVEDNQENHLAIGNEGRFGWNDSGGTCPGYVKVNLIANLSVEPGAKFSFPAGICSEIVLNSRGFTFAQAEREARLRSHAGRVGRLATINSSEESDHIDSWRRWALGEFGIPGGDPGSEPPLWIGGFQENSDGSVATGWKWLDGSNVGTGFGLWTTGQPDDGPGIGVEDGEENHLAIRGSARWSDEPGDTPLVGYVVEYLDPIPTEIVLRSTRYDGESAMRFGYLATDNPNVAMCIEAWIHRHEAGPTFQTILSQGYTNSFWFGLASGKLRFYRSGGFSEDSTVTVPTGQWTHVAVSYDGGVARFYIDGVAAGAPALGNGGTGTADDLYLGRDPGGTPNFLHASLDEVRLWSTTRSLAQIQANRFQEITAASGLARVWPRGGIDKTSGTLSEGSPRTERVGILPRNLVVPLASTQPIFDGNVNTDTEYAGAERVVLRYADGPNFRDAIAYLVHTREYLYVGVEGARLPSAGSPGLENVVAAFLDADGSTTGFDPDLHRGRVFLQDKISGYSRVKPVTVGTLTTNVWSDSPAPNPHQFQARMGTQVRDELSSVADMEFRFHRSLPGEFDYEAVDRFALVHANNGGPSGDRWSPDGADADTPATWVEMRYFPKADPDLPVLSASGTITNPNTGAPLSGVTVRLIGSSLLASTTSLSDGLWSFSDVLLPQGQPFSISFEPPPSSITNVNATATPGGIQPLSLSPTTAHFPPKYGGWIQPATISFFATTALPATTLAAFDPAIAWPPVLIRSGADPKRVTPTRVRVDGANLHPDIDFFFARPTCPNDLSGCTAGVDFFPADGSPASATFVPANSGDVAYFLVDVPDIPEIHWGFMRLTAHDLWSRPANNPLTAGSWKNFPNQITIGAPPYEILHAYAFRNISDGHDFDDYRAAFYDQICNPLHMVGTWAFFPIYLDLTVGGECLGLTVTAQRFARNPGTLSAYEPDVLKGFGFRTLRQFDGSEYPLTPATFGVSNPCSPTPTNLWGHVKASQGAQFSSEFIGESLAQISFDGPDHIDLRDQLNKIRTSPTQWLLCVRKGSSGHCVQPLRVIDTADPDFKQVEVWDNNRPGRRMTIDFDLSGPQRFTYDGGFEGGPWHENWVFVFRTDPLYDGERHVPSLDVVGAALGRFGVTHLYELLQMLVTGDAEPEITAGNGNKAGWDASRSFLEGGSQTVAIPNFNWVPGEVPALGHFPVSFHHRMDHGAPFVEIHNRGSSYKFHQSHHGTMFQIFVDGGVDGTRDQINMIQSGNRVLGMRFTAGPGGRVAGTRAVFSRNASSFPGAVFMQNVAVPAGTSIEVEVRPDNSALTFSNKTGVFISPNFDIVVPSSAAIPDIYDTPSVGMPAGSNLTIFTPDALDYANLVFAHDSDGNGKAEQFLQFIAATGEFVPYLATTPPYLRILSGPLQGQQGPEIVLVQPQGYPDWHLEWSQTLEEGDWDPPDFKQISQWHRNGETFYAVPLSTTRRFFRLARP